MQGHLTSWDHPLTTSAQGAKSSFYEFIPHVTLNLTALDLWW